MNISGVIQVVVLDESSGIYRFSNYDGQLFLDIKKPAHVKFL